MSFQGKLKRYLLILERVRRKATFAQLRDHLEQHGFAISVRTLQRDIEQVRVELGLEIVYDRDTNTYALPDAKDGRATVMPLLERAVLGQLLGASGEAIRKTAPHVVMERSGTLQGMGHWAGLLRAIQERHELEVYYQRFQSDTEQTIRLRPVLLKEYRARWYVLGGAEGYTVPISLGLDRILGFRATDKRFPVKERDAVEAHYAHIIGVDAAPGRAERVVLRFTPLQGRYMLALPLHASQRVLRNDAEGCEVELFVMPNTELRQELLSLGSTVEVLEPESLAEAIREEHRRAGGDQATSCL
jgi:predicted DNA-binding transcriptional regulator YafY